MQLREIPASLPIRAKLLLLILIIFLPASGVIIWMGLEHRNYVIEEAKENALKLAQSLAAQQEQFANGTKQMLITLAQLPEVRRLDSDACNKLFRDVHNRHPYYSTIGAVTPDGRLFASSVPFGPSNVNISEQKHIKDAIDSLDFSVGEYIVGKRTQVRSIHYSYPVFDPDKKLIAIVIAGFKLNEYRRLIGRANLPDDSAVIIHDHKGLRLYRLPEKDSAPLGRLPREGFEQIMAGRGEGTYERTADDGIYRIYAFKRLSLRDGVSPYLSIVVGIPKDPFVQEANARMLRSLLILGIAASIAMSLAWFYGNVALAKPIDQLVNAVLRLGRGETGTRTGVSHTPDELGGLAKSFDDMALMLEVRSIEREEAEKELRESEEKYRTVVENANDCIVVLQDERTVYCNPNYVKLIGYGLSEIENLRFFDIVVSEDRERAYQYYLGRMRGEAAPEVYELTLKKKQGAQATVEVKPCLIDYRGETATMLVMRDVTQRKRAEAALAESEARYRAVVEDQTELIIRFSPRGIVTFMNSAYRRYFGMKENEFADHTFWQMALEEDQESIREHVGSLGEKEPTGMIECRVVAAGGRIRWMQWVNRAIFGNEGQIFGYQGVGRDVTDLRLAQEKLKETTQRLKLAVASAHMGIWDWNIPLNELTWDDGMLSLYGISEDSFPMRIEGWEGALHPDDIIKTRADLHAALRGEKEYETDFRILRPDGTIRVFKANGLVIRNEEGRPIRVIGLNRDITDRKRAENALRESEQRFRALFEQAAVGVAEVEALTGRFIRVNQRYADIVGATIEELKNTTAQAITHPDDLQASLENSALIASGQIREFEMEKRYIRRDGGTTWVNLNVSPLSVPGDPPTRYMAVINDITERKRAVEAIEHKILALTQPSFELGQLKLTDIIGVNVLQKLQDGFSDFYGIPSLIWDRQGSPITTPSNFTSFCRLMRSSPKGETGCEVSDRRVGEIALKGASVIRDGCVIEGVMRAAIPIVIQGQHVATWGMGQVVEREIDEGTIRQYARKIEVDEEEFVKASRSLIKISRDKFESAAQFLSITAGQVSLLGLQNLQQARLIHERREAEEALRASEKELRFLSSRLLTAQEEERKRIAAEIHDGLGSSLSAVKIALENARSQLEEAGVGTISFDIPISWTQHAIDEARRLMTDLRPSLLDDVGLLPTVAWFFRQYRTIHSRIHIEEEIHIQENEISEPLKIVLFRIIQEAFHNISKYSKAEFVSMSLAKKEGTIELTIEDNGEGFDLQTALHSRDGRKGLGLTSMKERAELSGGEFSIESVPGEGTLIRACWPVGLASAQTEKTY